ncbi:major tail protein [Salmonella phage 21]|nr:major tail protein [Salmonella phage 21]
MYVLDKDMDAIPNTDMILSDSFVGVLCRQHCKAYENTVLKLINRRVTILHDGHYEGVIAVGSARRSPTSDL